MLISKRNDVFLMANGNEKWICKNFKDKESYHNEKIAYTYINQVGKLNCPKLLDFDDENLTLTIEYIEGITLLDVLEYCEKNNDRKKAVAYLKELIDWMKKFHEIYTQSNQKWMLFDVNLRNFIVHDEEIYGIDYELIQEGLQSDDYVKLIAMYLFYDPINSEFKKEVKKALCQYYDGVLGFNSKSLEGELKNQIRLIQIRRNLSVI